MYIQQYEKWILILRLAKDYIYSVIGVLKDERW